MHPLPRKTISRLAGVFIIFILFVLTLAFYRKLALTNLILADYDLLTYFYPYKDAAAAAIRSGRLPLWNPYLFTGVPFLANPQTAIFYPLNLPSYFLSAAEAVKYSIIFHVFLAGAFMYAFARLSLNLGRAASMAAALVFMFSGFLTQQTGHINQLNAAVWLPLVLLVFDLAWQRRNPAFILLGGLALASQILAGHSQVTFLLLSGLGLYFLFRLGQAWAEEEAERHQRLAWVAISFAAPLILGLGLSAAQLLPTLELSRLSIRGGGLPYREAISFSLPPWLLARSLLPEFSQHVFSEYIGYIGVLPLVLACVALGRRESRPIALFWLVLGLLSLFLALGGYNPLYEAISRLLPPLRLFRVPARWLYLYTFAFAALAGLGFQGLMRGSLGRGLLRALWSGLLWAVPLLALLALLQVAAASLGQGVPAILLPVWAGLILLSIALIKLLPRLPWPWARAAVLLVFIAAELFAAGNALEHNRATAPQAYQSLRPPVTQLLQDEGLYRILSIPRTDFDPGDIKELKSIFGRSLGQEDLYQLLVATKHVEALSPNLPMRYGISTLDGYDGGVLPLKRYVDFKGLLLEGVPRREVAVRNPYQADALLRDQLAAIPDTGFLGWLNVKYIITDKVGDLWLDNVYYDLSTPATAYPASGITISQLPSFAATSVGIIYRLDGAPSPPDPLAEVIVRGAHGRTISRIMRREQARPVPPASYYVKLPLDGALYPREITVRYLGQEGELVTRGMSLIDDRTGASEALVLNPRLRLVHSGNLKIYQNLDWRPRAIIMHRALWAEGDRQALALMRQREKGELVISGPPPAGLSVGTAPTPSGAGMGEAHILEYRPEHILIQAETDKPGYLLLTDSYYPGWRAWLDGRETPLLRADYLFRAVYLPSGSHQVEFRYQPDSFKVGLWISLATLAGMVAVSGILALRAKSPQSQGEV
jgi:hypothetical protein